MIYNVSGRGSIKESLYPADPKGEDWLPRIAFDTVFFIWVGIILFTTITALLVDALGRDRADQSKVTEEEHNVCFMCGMQRTAYDDCSMPPGSSSFDTHCHADHDPWMCVGDRCILPLSAEKHRDPSRARQLFTRTCQHLASHSKPRCDVVRVEWNGLRRYVAYVAHLREKPLVRCSGLEAFVKESLTADGAWVPARASFALQAQGKFVSTLGPGPDLVGSGGKSVEAEAAGAK